MTRNLYCNVEDGASREKLDPDNNDDDNNDDYNGKFNTDHKYN